jgi:hypothetical protein
LQHKDEEQWVQDRALKHAYSHLELLAVMTVNPQTTPGIAVHALDNTYTPVLDTVGF